MIKQLFLRMGHGIRYHYEDLSIAKGDISLAVEVLEKIEYVETILRKKNSNYAWQAIVKI